ncbi:MAG: hypothetical protein JW934_10085 [Anaerolineae bacterium]|nr:hypothetical protein [Anaerolineae bacterium]
MDLEEASCTEREPFDLDHLLTCELEQMLVSMLVVRYPGIEQCDVDRLLTAIATGNVDQIGQAEADMALKSAQWMTAVLKVDQQWTSKNTATFF